MARKQPQTLLQLWTKFQLGGVRYPGKPAIPTITTRELQILKKKLAEVEEFLKEENIGRISFLQMKHRISSAIFSRNPKADEK